MSSADRVPLEPDAPSAATDVPAGSAARPEPARGLLTGYQVGDYRLLERLGGGVMAAVYRAVNVESGAGAAVKVLLPDADATVRERFRQEARTHGLLSHPNIVPIVGEGQEAYSGITYLVMDLVDGPGLNEVIEERDRLTPRDAAAVLGPVARALAYAHQQGIVHRDVKPSNVLLQEATAGALGVVRVDALARWVIPLLSDFGIARALDAPELTGAGRTIGTPTYMSPEQCADSHDLDGRSDIYSLGAVFYRCVVGRPPFTGSTTQILHAHVYDPLMIPEAVLAALPPAAVEVLRRSLAKEPAGRYASGSEMALADFRGKVVLLNFWATWCPPCRREMPSMERVHQELNAGPFSVIAINEYESPDHVFAYVGQLSTDPTFPILFDPDSAVSELYQVRGLPTTYLIDKHGRIRYRAIGGREYDHPEVLGTIRALMAED